MRKNILSLLSKLAVLSILLFGSVFSINSAQAEDTVILRATVVERKSTDTLNDFDFSTVNTISSEKLNSINLEASNEEGTLIEQKKLVVKFIIEVVTFFKSF